MRGHGRTLLNLGRRGRRLACSGCRQYALADELTLTLDLTIDASRNGDYGDLAPEDIRETVPVTVDRFDQLGPERLGRR
jgi:hypothetical protein